MSNQKSHGKDNTPFKLIKNAPNIAHQQISLIINNTLSEYEPK